MRRSRLESGQGALAAGLRWIGKAKPAHRPARDRRFTAEEIMEALYRALLGREPDPPGLAGKLHALRSAATLEYVVREMVSSAEFSTRILRELVPASRLPNLISMMPDRYQPATSEKPCVYLAHSDAAVDDMERLIRQHRYYDRFDVWSPVIDLDKQAIAAVVRGLGARSCFELGCFTGPVLSLLAQSGIAVAGCEVSHYAFAFAYPNIRDAMLYGDLLDLEIDRRFDVVLCIDVLEHLSPLRLADYIARLASLIESNGRVYLNSPMWGHDEVFGVAAEQCLDEWRSVGDRSFWREWPCDEAGWPEHGHLIWASPNWWTAKFAEHGLRRDIAAERVIHHRLGSFFDNQAPGRRSLFVLYGREGQPSSAADTARLDAALAPAAGLGP